VILQNAKHKATPFLKDVTFEDSAPMGFNPLHSYTRSNEVSSLAPIAATSFFVEHSGTKKI